MLDHRVLDGGGGRCVEASKPPNPEEELVQVRLRELLAPPLLGFPGCTTFNRNRTGEIGTPPSAAAGGLTNASVQSPNRVELDQQRAKRSTLASRRRGTPFLPELARKNSLSVAHNVSAHAKTVMPH